jgi:hypothetical protein
MQTVHYSAMQTPHKKTSMPINHATRITGTFTMQTVHYSAMQTPHRKTSMPINHAKRITGKLIIETTPGFVLEI